MRGGTNLIGANLRFLPARTIEGTNGRKKIQQMAQCSKPTVVFNFFPPDFRTRGAQQDKNKYRIQDELYRIQYSLASIIVYGQKKQVDCENIVKQAGAELCQAQSKMG